MDYLLHCRPDLLQPKWPFVLHIFFFHRLMLVPQTKYARHDDANDNTDEYCDANSEQEAPGSGQPDYEPDDGDHNSSRQHFCLKRNFEFIGLGTEFHEGPRDIILCQPERAETGIPQSQMDCPRYWAESKRILPRW